MSSLSKHLASTCGWIARSPYSLHPLIEALLVSLLSYLQISIFIMMSPTCMFSLLAIFVTVPILSNAMPTIPVPLSQSIATKYNTTPPLGVKKVYSHKLCDPAERAVEQVSWVEAAQYAQALSSWRINSSFQPAMDLYMGNDSRGSLSSLLEGSHQFGRFDGSAVRGANLSVQQIYWERTKSITNQHGQTITDFSSSAMSHTKSQENWKGMQAVSYPSRAYQAFL